MRTVRKIIGLAWREAFGSSPAAYEHVGDQLLAVIAARRKATVEQMRAPAFDSRDHLHPNDAGYKAMGDGIDLALFK